MSNAFLQVSKYSLLVFFLLFAVFGCSSKPKGSETLFLENVMIREAGMYVLLGSKPMSSFPIEDSGFPETDEETLRAYNLYLSEIEAGNLQEKPIGYDEFKEHCQRSVHLHFRYLWEVVKDELKGCVGPRYRFVARRNPFGERRKGGLFINVPNTILVLKRNYQEFAQVYGGRFNVDSILDEIEDDASEFWVKVFQSNYLSGLLFGYGRHNSCEFDWRMRNGLSIPRLAIKGQEIEPLMKTEVRISDLRLPSISVYSPTDRKLEKYRRERELIVKELEGKDFIAVVKSWLSLGFSENIE